MARKQNRQRKLERKVQKAVERRERLKQTSSRSPSRTSPRGLEVADELLDSGEYAEAIELLEELSRRYPRRVEVIARLAEAYLRTNDRWSYQATCAKLTAIDPGDPRGWLALGAAAMGNAQPATAARAFAHVMAHWPDHPDAGQIGEMLESVESFLAEESQSRGLEAETARQVLLWHDEINLHLHRNKFDEVCDVASRLLAISPTFAPALNNRSEAHFRSGRYAEAIADSRQVLEFDPANFHALGNLARYLYLAGQFAEARATAARLAECKGDHPDLFSKQTETFAMLGDWNGVLKAFEAGQKAWKQSGGTPAISEHLAGVAYANLGDLEAAQRHWRSAAEGPGAIGRAQANLADSKLPVGQRHGPWAFPVEDWVPSALIAPLGDLVAAEGRKGSVKRAVQRYFDQYPQLELLADDLLERGDPAACKLLIGIAPLVKRTAIYEALKKFAVGQRGSDELRIEALTTLSQAEYLTGEVPMWRQGELHPIRVLAQEVTGEPTLDLPEEISRKMMTAHRLLQSGQAAQAERLFGDVVRLRPDDPAPKFNRAMAVGMQGREEEALKTIRQIHREHPDYVFARTHLAGEAIAKGDLEEAKTLLGPITQKQRLHTSEYAAWSSANIELALALGDYNLAERLLSGWEEVSPDDGRIEMWRERLEDRS